MAARELLGRGHPCAWREDGAARHLVEDGTGLLERRRVLRGHVVKLQGAAEFEQGGSVHGRAVRCQGRGLTMASQAPVEVGRVGGHPEAPCEDVAQLVQGERALDAEGRGGVEGLSVDVDGLVQVGGVACACVPGVERRAYDLDLESAWPRLWLVVPEPVRAELLDAREKVDTSCRLVGWGMMYLLLGAMWWPALVIGMCTLVVAWRRERAALDACATLVEATVDVHGRDLALSLGIPCEGAFTHDVGATVTRALQKPLQGG
ncbi:hypothetical protein SUDANB140_04038 [Streptomyces sp. enrichment culture]